MLRSITSNKARVWIKTRQVTNQAFVRSLPDRAFSDPALYDIERKHMLGTSWQLIGHESQLVTSNDRAPATYIAETICGWPTIVVKSAKTGQLHAYHNVCRHKGGPFQWDNTSGVCDLNGLKCKYHGWAFSLEGKLLGVPAFAEACDGKIDRSEFNLWPMRVALWRGLVFVQALPNTPEDPFNGLPLNGPEANEAFLAANKAFCDRLSGVTSSGAASPSSTADAQGIASKVPLEDFQFHSSATHKLNCNWKLYIENYLEGYHIPTIHPELNKQVVMKEYRVKVCDGYVEHITPTSADAAYEGVWLWHHPTLALNYYGNGLSLERIVPTGPKTTEIRYTYLFRNAQSSTEEERLQSQRAIDTSAEVTQEDIQIVEAVQRSLDGGAYTSPGILSPRHEQGVAYFQGLVREAHARGGVTY